MFLIANSLFAEIPPGTTESMVISPVELLKEIIFRVVKIYE